jgi:probable HAF family extracellular repeat protein
MRGVRQSPVRLSLMASVLLLLATAGWSQSITWLGTLPGYNRSEASGVSADGSVVVGWAYNAAWQDRAFRWTAAGGMQDLSTTYASRKEDQGR